MAAPDPATNEWVPVWNPTAIGPVGPMGPQGPAGGAVANAKYWLVEPFGGLVNARALNAFTTGYVRSTVGEPSVVPTIPLTDTTGILPDNRLTSNVALKNIDNFFAVQTFSANSVVRGPTGMFIYYDTSGPVDAKLWRTVAYSDGVFWLEALNDANAIYHARFGFTRGGKIVSALFEGNGSLLTMLNASALATGLAAPARLGSGTANSSTFLRGDSTWAPVTDSFPSGLIVLYDAPCPPGWTRVTAWDGRYIRSGVGGVGGTASHTHNFGATMPSHNHGGIVGITGNTGNAGGHSHTGSVNGETSVNTSGDMNVDAGNSGEMARGPHKHNVNLGFGTTHDGDHSHSISLAGGIPNDGGQGINGTTAAAANDPLFVDLFLCRKN